MLNPEKQNAVFCPVCGFVDFWSKNVIGETIYPGQYPNGKCKHCGHQIVDTPIPFEDFYISNDDAYEEEFLNTKYILENYVFTNNQYDRNAHIKQLEIIKAQKTSYGRFSNDIVITRIQQEILKLYIQPHVPYNNNKYEKVFYCPRCGRLEVIEYFEGKPWNEYKLKEITKRCECGKEFPMFSKERKSAKMIKSEEIFYDGDSVSLIYLNDKEIHRTQPGEPKTADKLSPSIYQYYWNKYVIIPQNKQLDRNLFEKYKNKIDDFWKAGGHRPIYIDSYATGSNSQKDASVVGRAVAGGVIAGPVGAVVGAASAIDKNLKNNK